MSGVRLPARHPDRGRGASPQRLGRGRCCPEPVPARRGGSGRGLARGDGVSGRGCHHAGTVGFELPQRLRALSLHRRRRIRSPGLPVDVPGRPRCAVVRGAGSLRARPDAAARAQPQPGGSVADRAGAGVVVVVDFLHLTVMQPAPLHGEIESLALLSQYNPHGVFIGAACGGSVAFERRARTRVSAAITALTIDPRRSPASSHDTESFTFRYLGNACCDHG